METEEFSTKSRVRGDFQARFREKGRVKFPPTYSTRFKTGNIWVQYMLYKVYWFIFMLLTINK